MNPGVIVESAAARTGTSGFWRRWGRQVTTK